VTVTQQRQTAEVFAPLLEQLRGKTDEEIVAFAEEFKGKNSSFNFCFITDDGEVLFQTDGIAAPDDINSFQNGYVRFSENTFAGDNYFIALRNSDEDRILFLARGESGLRLYVASTFSGTSVYTEILGKAVWVFGLVFLVSLFAAFLFARKIAEPIKKVSSDTHAMSLLMPVEPPKDRKDEIGQLSKDVYAMYSRLKTTIRQLETEVEHVKQMEENQRYFFSAASHELKTPIAAVGAILEGMINDVIVLEEYPSYLREGMKLVNEQNKLVSEILELVKLNGEIPTHDKEPINLRQCVEAVLEPLSPLIESKGQVVDLDIGDGMICELNGGLFSKALSNVLLNAAQNSPGNSKIRINAKEGLNRIYLNIWNSDAEIPKEILPKLCEPFYRADEARTSGEGRNGLGLAIVKKALDLMGVDFAIGNEDGGVLFQMEIPYEKLD
jgi:two-component system sensor histidine kinase VanS